MRTTVKLVLVLIGVAAIEPAGAFSAAGHRVAGAVAEAHLCDRAGKWLGPLLAGATLGEAGVWADAIRDDPAWQHTRSWHYINVGDRESIGRVARSGDDNVVAALGRAEADLANPRLPVPRRAEALRFFVHFVADLHQPLHVGRSEDRGGNEIEVRWGKQRLDLHEFWDANRLLRSTGLGERELASAVGALATVDARHWLGSGPLDWAEESRALRPLVYGLPGGEVPVLPRAYVAMARNVVSLRLAQAGVRIAGRLNRLACPEGASARPGAASR